MRTKKMRTEEVLNEILAGKRMSEKYKATFKDVFKSLGAMYVEFPSKRVEVNKWLASIDGFADTTVRLWFQVLRSGCEYMADNYELINPCKGIDTPKVLKKKRRYYRVDEIGLILQACRGEYEFALVTSLIDSTCRIGELASLRVEDIGDSWIDVKGKTGEKRYRLDPRLCELLRSLNKDGQGTVFGATSRALGLRVRRICKRAGITGSKLGPHTLRHSSASLVASETRNVLAVKAILQHDKVETSMLYIHDVEEEIQKGISPLALVSDKLSAGVKQLPMKGTPDYIEGEVLEVSDEVGVVDGLALEMFPDIPDGAVVRPLLKTDDLRLIRSGFLALFDNGRYNVDVGRGRELLKRMMRKVR